MIDGDERLSLVPETQTNSLKTVETRTENIKMFLKVAAPFTVSTLVVAIGNFTSAKLLSMLGTDELAASGLITSSQLLMQGFLFSPLYAVGIHSAQAVGADDKEKVNASIQQGMVASFIFSIPMVTLSKFVGAIFNAAGQKKDISHIAQKFFNGYILGCYGDVFLVATQQHAIALGEQHAVLISSILQKGITLGLSAGLMFGSPKMGALGMGYSYSVGALSTLLGLNTYLAIKGKLNLSDMFSFSKFWERQSHLRQLMATGLPISLHIGSELAVLSALIAMSGYLSTQKLTSAELVFQYTGFVLVPIIGASQATGILVSNALAGKNPELAKTYANIGLGVGMIIPVVSGILMITLYKQLTGFFVDLAVSENRAILEDAKVLFMINGLTMIPDFLRNLSTGALRGTFDTTVPMLVNLGLCAVNFGLSYLGGFILKWGNEGIYGARSLSITVMAAILTIRWLNKINKLISPVSSTEFSPTVITPLLGESNNRHRLFTPSKEMYDVEDSEYGAQTITDENSTSQRCRCIIS